MLFRYALLVVFLSGVALADYGDLLKKCGLKKIYESCFGEALMEEKFKEFTHHVMFCKNESTPGQSVRMGFNWQAALSAAGPGDNSPLYLPVPIITDDGRRKLPFSTSYRGKRHAFFDEDKLRKLKTKVIKKLKTTSCVLQRMNILDEDLNVQWNELQKLYTKDYGFERELKDDLVEVFNKCKNFVQCMPMDQKPGSFPLGLRQMMYYKKCEMKKKTAACIKKDLRKKPEMFELQGLDGMLDHYEDEDDKMLKVLKLYTKFGDDDGDLFY